MKTMTPEIKISNEHDLVRVAPKDPKVYEDISLAHLTAYSLFWLHQWQLRRTIEAVAILNWRLFPSKFGMVSFPEYPDAFRTNRSLLQGQPKYRNFLTGAASKGFSLNERGMEMARDLIAKLGPPSTADGEILGRVPANESSVRTGGRARSLEPGREMQRVRESKLFEKWKLGLLADRDLIHVHSLLGIFDHTPAQVRQKAMKDLVWWAQEIKDEEMLRFLTEVRRVFSVVFAPQ